MQKILSSRRGQSAIEYMSTYGWAVIVILVSFIAVWQLGLFEMEERLQPISVGFSVLVPGEWKVAKTGSTCELSVLFYNGAYENLSTIDFQDGTGECSPETIAPGEKTLCTRTIGSCGELGSRYRENVVVTYERAIDAEEFQSAGTFEGNIES